MPKIIACQKVRSQVLALQTFSNNTIAVSTKLHGIEIFQADSCQSKQILSIAQISAKTTAIAMHPTKHLCAVANEETIYIISLTNRALLQTIYTKNGTITLLQFMPNTPYLIGATAQARVMLYRYDAHMELSRLFSSPYSNTKTQNNYIHAVAVSKNYIAASSNGGVVRVIYCNSFKEIKKITLSKVCVESLAIIDEQILLFGNRQGTLYLTSLENDKKSSALHMPFIEIKNILHFPQSDFALVSGQSRSIALVNIRTKKLITPKYITFDAEVESMAFSSQTMLVVILKNRHMQLVEFATLNDLTTCIVQNNIVKAFEIINADPRFQGTKEHKRVEALYEKLYTKAFTSLINSNKQELQEALVVIKQIDSKADSITLLFKAYKNYAKFKQLHLEKKYALAYTLSEKFPPLQYTPQYKKMEADFQKAYTFSQKQILLGHLDAAKAALLPFITVLAKRPLISLLLRQHKEFLAFLQALQNKNYKRIDAIVTKNEVFKDIPAYSSLLRSQESLLENIKNSIDNADPDKAIKQLESLEFFPCNKALAKELYAYALCVKKLLLHYKNNDFKKCYELIDKERSLQNITIAKLLEKHWQKLMNTCEQYALAGDIQSIKERLGELMTLPLRAKRVGDLLRLSFFVKIRQLIHKNKFHNAENIIYSYIDIFGIDKEIQNIMQYFEKYTTKKLAITHKQNEKRSWESWLDSMT